jgi:hypothetical protein
MPAPKKGSAGGKCGWIIGYLGIERIGEKQRKWSTGAWWTLRVEREKGFERK